MRLLAANSGAALYPLHLRFQRIQAMRLFAAAFVVVGHTTEFFDLKHAGILSETFVTYTGWLGGWSVSLFFGISGFVITHSSFGQPATRFAAARLLRIYPGFWLACMVAVLIKFAVFGVLSVRAEGIDLHTLSLLPFGTRTYPLRIEWSLIFEVFFYALVALFLTLRTSRDLVWLMTAWLIVIIAVAASPYDYSARLPQGAWVIVSNRNLPFIAGALVYFLGQHPLARRVRSFLPIWALAAALSAQIVYGAFWIILTQAVSAGLLIAFVVQRDIDAPISRDNVLVRLGDASYGLYLIHITIITVILEKWAGSAYVPLTLASLLLFALAGGLLFGFIEQSLYHRLRRLAFHRAAPLTAASAPADDKEALAAPFSGTVMHEVEASLQ